MNQQAAGRSDYRLDLTVEPGKVTSDGRTEVTVVCKVRDPNGKPPGDGAKVRFIGPKGANIDEERPLVRGSAVLKFRPDRPTGRTRIQAHTPWGQIQTSLDVQPTSGQLVREYFFAAVIAIGLALAIRQTLITAFWIPSASMEPTLYKGDRLIASRIHYLLGDPKRGDIVIFKHREEPEKHSIHIGPIHKEWITYTDYIKRAIGVGGDVVEIRDGVVYVNGNALDEKDYIKEPPVRDMDPVRVESGKLFMMGDNRNNSRDSRFWGQLDRKDVEARALFLYWPLNRIRIIH